MLASSTAKLTFAFLLGYLLLGAMNVSWELGHNMTLKENEAEAIAWVRENTPEDSRFIIVTGEQPMTDTLSEWFPTLTERQSLATVQGFEWMPGGILATKMKQYGEIQYCITHDETCLFNWAARTGQSFDYVIVRQNASFPNPALQTALEKSGAMQKVFELPGIAIFALRKP
jgi:hypothetical protein